MAHNRALRQNTKLLTFGFLACISAIPSLSQSHVEACEVDKALQSRHASPPAGLSCQTKTSCFDYIQCAFKQDNAESHKKQWQWHEAIILSTSAILEKLPPPNPNPKLAEYYREFFVMVSNADQSTDVICAEANTQIVHLGPLLRMLQLESATKSSLDGNQEALVQISRTRYKSSLCYDQDLLRQVMNSPPPTANDNNAKLVAALLGLISSNSQQQDSTHKTSPQCISSAVGGVK